MEKVFNIRYFGSPGSLSPFWLVLSGPCLPHHFPVCSTVWTMLPTLPLCVLNGRWAAEVQNKGVGSVFFKNACCSCDKWLRGVDGDVLMQLWKYNNHYRHKKKKATDWQTGCYKPHYKKHPNYWIALVQGTDLTLTSRKIPNFKRNSLSSGSRKVELQYICIRKTSHKSKPPWLTKHSHSVEYLVSSSRGSVPP